MSKNWIEAVTGSLEDKKAWRAHKARRNALPEPYLTAINAVERYLMYAGGITKSDSLVAMNEDLVELFEQAAADGTPIRDIVGDNPVEFVEDFVRNYEDGGWVAKERKRLTESLDGAIAQQR